MGLQQLIDISEEQKKQMAEIQSLKKMIEDMSISVKKPIPPIHLDSDKIAQVVLSKIEERKGTMDFLGELSKLKNQMFQSMNRVETRLSETESFIGFKDFRSAVIYFSSFILGVSFIALLCVYKVYSVENEWKAKWERAYNTVKQREPQTADRFIAVLYGEESIPVSSKKKSKKNK